MERKYGYIIFRKGKDGHYQFVTRKEWMNIDGDEWLSFQWGTFGVLVYDDSEEGKAKAKKDLEAHKKYADKDYVYGITTWED